MLDQARIDRSPACAVVGGKKDTAAICPGKEIRAGDGKRIDTMCSSSRYSPQSSLCRCWWKERRHPLVPAKRFVPETARAVTKTFVKPVLAVVQLVPLFVERKTPPSVPAKRFVPETARALTYCSSSRYSPQSNLCRCRWKEKRCYKSRQKDSYRRQQENSHKCSSSQYLTWSSLCRYWWKEKRSRP